MVLRGRVEGARRAQAAGGQGCSCGRRPSVRQRGVPLVGGAAGGRAGGRRRAGRRAVPGQRERAGGRARRRRPSSCAAGALVPGPWRHRWAAGLLVRGICSGLGTAGRPGLLVRATPGSAAARRSPRGRRCWRTRWRAPARAPAGGARAAEARRRSRPAPLSVFLCGGGARAASFATPLGGRGCSCRLLGGTAGRHRWAAGVCNFALSARTAPLDHRMAHGAQPGACWAQRLVGATPPQK